MQETKQIGKGILSGLIAIFIVMVVTSLLVSLMLTFTSMQESSFKWMIMILSFAALLLGGIISGGKAKERGWLIGAVTSIIFSLTVFLFSIFGVWKNVFTRAVYLSWSIFRHLYAGGNDWRQSSRQIKKERSYRSFFMAMYQRISLCQLIL